MSDSTFHKICGLIALVLYIIVSNMSWNDEIAMQRITSNPLEVAQQ